MAIVLPHLPGSFTKLVHLEGCYPPQPSASVDNTLPDQLNSSYPTQLHSLIAN